MTKQEEINHLNQFVDNLPEGYLQDIFKDVRPMITDAIQSDFCIIPIHEMRREKIDLTKEIAELQKQKQELENTIKTLQNNKEFLENSLVQAKQKLSSMARMMLNAV